MSLDTLGALPAHVSAEGDFAAWFAAIGTRLLNTVDFLVAGHAYRFAELEAYYHGRNHFDIFAHRDPLQLENGRWYFHKTGGEYRSGSFKGLDLALGDGTAHFGILIRTIVDGDGKVINGPSLTVDHLLAATRTRDISTLDGLIGGRKIWDTSSPLAIRDSAVARTAAVHGSTRVGLSLKRNQGIQAARFVGQPYRYLTEPRTISKGKLHLVLSLHRQGLDALTIQELTGCPRKTIERYFALFEEGNNAPGFECYLGKDLDTSDLCRLHGTWHARYQ